MSYFSNEFYEATVPIENYECWKETLVEVNFVKLLRTLFFHKTPLMPASGQKFEDFTRGTS